MKLGIVGSGAAKFSAETEELARDAIVINLLRYGADEVVSGGCDGVDQWAADEGRKRGLKVTEFVPTSKKWGDPGGFKERNLEIASYSDHVIAIVVRELPPGFKGKAYTWCYHCNDLRARHCKSAGCFTAMRAKSASWVII